ncbi:hypothetical protein ABTY98_02275 [Streptomyces sp. NPDC096040]|uniref:hypothetical protein n=1 Tax=Streptomyces sp. NPDC096040 TaxID=3155541 RepID=UPI003319A8F2
MPALNRDPGATVPVLDRLYADASQDVRRSVANHLNDISRLDAALAGTAARRMRTPAPATSALVRHAKVHGGQRARRQDRRNRNPRRHVLVSPA